MVIRRGFRLGIYLGALVALVKTATRFLGSRAATETAMPAAPQWPSLPDPVAAPVAPAAPAAPPIEATVEATPPPPAPAEVKQVPTKKLAGPATKAAAAPATKAAAAPAKKAAAKKAPAKKLSPWVDPVDGACPPTHVVKAKLASKLYHEPGMFAYDRTRPDRCYLDGPTAEADGFTRAKR